MGACIIKCYCEQNGNAPVLAWLKRLPPKIQDKCFVKLERLAALGHELRRPEADYLRDDIYELRIRFQSVNYRILYFFHGRDAVILAHSLTKESYIPLAAIELAIERRKAFKLSPELHVKDLR